MFRLTLLMVVVNLLVSSWERITTVDVVEVRIVQVVGNIRTVQPVENKVVTKV